MEKKKLASIEIWNEKFYIGAVMSFLDSMADKHRNMIFDRWNKMRFVAGQILEDRIKNAYPDGHGKITVELFYTDAFVEISVKDEGVPEWTDYSYEKSSITEEEKSFKNYLLDLWVDEVGMENLGKNGQRTFVRQHLLNKLIFDEPEPYQETEVLDENITIKQVKTEQDALEAIRCIYSAYGYAYGYERLYYIDSFMKLIQSGEIMSFLAVNNHGQVAGHYALTLSNMYKNMPEISTVVVRKEFRKLGLFNMFMEHSIKVAEEHKFRALMGQPVAFHPMTQKGCIKTGFTATSLLMGYLDPSMAKEYRKDDERMNLFACVKIMDDKAESSVYMPEEIIPIARKIYDGLGWKYEFLKGGSAAAATELSAETNSMMKTKQILLHQSGPDIEQILAANVKDAIRRKCEMIELIVSLDSPSCEYGYLKARECGFALSGLMPGGENGDYIIMQMMMGTDFTYDKLVAVGDFKDLADEIVAYNA